MLAGSEMAGLFITGVCSGQKIGTNVLRRHMMLMRPMPPSLPPLPRWRRRLRMLRQRASDSSRIYCECRRLLRAALAKAGL